MILFFRTADHSASEVFFYEEIEGTWCSITRKETFRKFYENIRYPNPIRSFNVSVNFGALDETEKVTR